MKKIVLFCFLFIFSVSQVFSASVSLESEVSTIELWQTFDVYIDVQRDDTESVEIDTIWWIENFSILWQSQQERYVNINGEVQTETKLLFTLQPKQSGDFDLWPVSATSSWVTFSSNTVDIQVVSENTIAPQTEVPESVDILDIFEESENNISLKWYPLFILVFFILFYVLVAKFMKKDNVLKVEEPPLVVNKNDIFISRLRKLKTNAWKQEKAKFYSAYNEIIREFLASNWYTNAEKMTLKEIKILDISNAQLLSIFEESYTREFDTRTDTIDDRKKLIDSFIVQLKK